MPILTISELVLNELSQMHFLFGGTPADVVEYDDGGRKASGQAIAVEGLEAVTDNWVVQDPSVVPTADENGMIPEFYGPKGIIALKVDFGFGPVVMRADAANLHKELRDLLLARLSQLQVDEENFRQAVSGELDAMRAEIDTTVSSTLAQVEDLINTSLGAEIQDAVDAKLATDLQPTLDAAINDVLNNDVPPLIASEVAAQVPPEVDARVAGLQDDLNQMQQLVDANGVAIANTNYQVDANRARITTAENRLSAVEVVATLTSWSRTVTTTDAIVTVNLMRLQNAIFVELELTARQSNKGTTGYVARGGIGIPSAFLPGPNGLNIAAAATIANGQLIDPENFRIGITPSGDVFSQGYEAWHQLRGNGVYFR